MEKKNICESCHEKCCVISYVQLTKEEAEKLKDNVVEVNGILFLKNVGSKCIFLGKEKCTLSYEDRPLSCKLYPIGFTLENGKPVVSVDKNCPLSKHINLKKENSLIQEAIESGLDQDIAISEDD
ncbi:MAG: YkgJ family cysteine cluster protein [Nanoarchaeota archaeon]|nr:YkgJ family cysteine cluster protein [Nanoarchaeota archaeon]